MTHICSIASYFESATRHNERPHSPVPNRNRDTPADMHALLLLYCARPPFCAASVCFGGFLKWLYMFMLQVSMQGRQSHSSSERHDALEAEKYVSNTRSRCLTRFFRARTASRSRVSIQPRPSPSSSSKCVYANTLASNRPGLAAPKNHSSLPSAISSAAKASSAWL